MSSMAVKLTDDHLERIAEYLSEKFPALRQRSSSGHFRAALEMDIREGRCALRRTKTSAKLYATSL